MIYARRGHPGDLGDEHRDFLESPVLREHARLLGSQGRDGPAAVSVFPRALLGAAELGRAGLRQPHLLHRAGQRQPLRAWKEPDVFMT